MDRKRDTSWDLDIVQNILKDMVMTNPRSKITKKHKCILLELMGNGLDAKFEEMRLVNHRLNYNIDEVVDSPDRRLYYKDLLTDLTLQVNVGDHWGIQACLFEENKFTIIIFAVELLQQKYMYKI